MQPYDLLKINNNLKLQIEKLQIEVGLIRENNRTLSAQIVTLKSQMEQISSPPLPKVDYTNVKVGVNKIILTIKHKEKIKNILKKSNLRPYQKSFLDSVLNYRELSNKQYEILTDIFNKYPPT